MPHKDTRRQQTSEPRTAPVIGLTGNIACGKSTVLRVLSDLGAGTIDADAVAHDALRPGTDTYASVLEAFGDEILNQDATINRRALGTIVFQDPRKLRQLEAIIHPYVRERVREALDAADGPFVIDAVKLLEGGLRFLCDQIWVVTCPKAQQVERLMARNSYTREEALVRVRAQGPQSAKVAAADVVIDNGGSRENTRAQVERAWEAALTDHNYHPAGE